jgi:2'-5' RNA ligase
VRALEPSPDSALIIRVQLPPGLEALRRRHVAGASQGLPAHVTLLYPFAEPDAIDGDVQDRIGAVVGRHHALTLRLGGLGRWPDALYATVEPAGPVRALQAELAAAFPSLPLYGDPPLRFEPHATAVEGPGVQDPAVAADPAWAELPVDEQVAEVELIVKRGDRWATTRAFGLSGATRRRGQD